MSARRYSRTCPYCGNEYAALRPLRAGVRHSCPSPACQAAMSAEHNAAVGAYAARPRPARARQARPIPASDWNQLAAFMGAGRKRAGA